jgi:hypothetical protein
VSVVNLVEYIAWYVDHYGTRPKQRCIEDFYRLHKQEDPHDATPEDWEAFWMDV